MIFRWSLWFRRIRRWLSRSEWAVRLLGLPKSRGTETQHGLLLIQIDGLSRTQLERAIEARRMPFVRHLIRQERYRLHTFYSGLPSTTPAVQGELFYDHRCAVPAFSFREHQSGEIVRMYYPDPVMQVEKRLDRDGKGLLRDGSAYCDIFSGGADECHFCSATLGWGGVLQTLNPFHLAALILVHGWSLLRTAVLMIVELGLAVVDCLRGAMRGYDLWKEMRLIPGRVLVTIWLREMIIMGATLDVTRGLPVVHVNLLGYDEQAHRRGPSSAFAHWTLKGVDTAIRRMWRAARRSALREYDIWIYSDHGQEQTCPYQRKFGRTVQQAVEAVVGQTSSTAPLLNGEQERRPSYRASWLGAGWFADFLVGARPENNVADGSSASVTAMGPIAHVYLPKSTTVKQHEKWARELVEDAQIPLVMRVSAPDAVTAYTDHGLFELPRQAAEVLGSNHPFLPEVGVDLVELCQHSDAGDLVLSGWRPQGQQLTFPVENGSHCGPGSEETRAFALLPVDAPLPDLSRDYLRPGHLRTAVLNLLKQGTPSTLLREPRAPTDISTLRLMTYNVHYCIGMDGKLSPGRIARVIDQCRVDVACLQELENLRPRTGHMDQAHQIARDLEMKFHFHPAWRLEEEQQGDAILSRVPLRLVRSAPLPCGNGRLRIKPRGALWVELSIEEHTIQLINTHLDLVPAPRRAQAQALLGPEWLGHPDCQDPAILCGDFNAHTKSEVYRLLSRRLRDAQTIVNGHSPISTWSGVRPLVRIDHVFLSPQIKVNKVEVLQTELARVASDHLPLIVELEFVTA